MFDDHSKAFRWGRRGGDWVLFLVAFCGLFIMLGLPAFWESEGVLARAAQGYNLNNNLDWNFLQESNKLLFSGYWYWMNLLAKSSGEVSEFLFRLPSVIAALVTLLATVRSTRWLFGREESRCAGWLLVGSLGYLVFGRIATGDMILVAFFMSAIWFFFNHRSWMDYRSWLIFFCISIGGVFFGSMAGGFWSFLLPLLVVWPFVRGRYIRGMVAGLLTVLFLVASLFWFSLFERLEDWGTLFFSGYGYGYSSIITPLGDMLILAFPWFLLNLAALVEIVFCYTQFPRRLRKFTSGMLWLFLGFAILGADNLGRWLLFLPLTQMVTSAVLCFEVNGGFWRKIHLVMRFLVIVVASMAVISLLLLPFWQRLFGIEPPWQFLVILPLIGLVSLAVMIYDENRRQQLAKWSGLPADSVAILIGGAILAVGIFGWLAPLVGSMRSLPEFAKAHSGQSSSKRIFWKEGPSNILAFYLNSPVRQNVAQNAADLGKLKKGQGVEIWVQSIKDVPSFGEAARVNGWGVNLDKPTFKERQCCFEVDSINKVQVWVIDPVAGE